MEDTYLYDLYNLTNNSISNLDVIYEPTDAAFEYVSSLTLKDNCSLNNPYAVTQSYNGLVNCSTCLQPNPDASISFILIIVSTVFF